MLLIGFWLFVTVQTLADDWPMLGRDGSRNSVSPEQNPPTVWSVAISEADLFEADFGDATVVTAYLYSDLLKRLLPKFEKLKPGSRIVTHQFAIPGISPEETVRIVSQETGAEHTIYFWTTPLRKGPSAN